MRDISQGSLYQEVYKNCLCYGQMQMFINFILTLVQVWHALSNNFVRAFFFYILFEKWFLMKEEGGGIER